MINAKFVYIMYSIYQIQKGKKRGKTKCQRETKEEGNEIGNPCP